MFLPYDTLTVFTSSIEPDGTLSSISAERTIRCNLKRDIIATKLSWIVGPVRKLSFKDLLLDVFNAASKNTRFFDNNLISC